MFKKLDKLQDLDYGDANGGYTVITKPAAVKPQTSNKSFWQLLSELFGKH